MKSILKKSFIDISVSCMIILICCILASFFPYLMNYVPEQRLIFYDLLFKVVLGLLVIIVLGVILYHFIMQTRIFNAKKFTRRAISMLVLFFLTVFVNLSVFSFIPTVYALIGVGCIAALGVLGAVAGFIIEDRFIKQDIEVINQRLIELKKEE